MGIIADLLNTAMRDFQRYSGDGLPNEPAGRPLPVGDPASGQFNPPKKLVRDAFLAIAETADDLTEAVEAAAGSANDSDQSANTAAVQAAISTAQAGVATTAASQAQLAAIAAGAPLVFELPDPIPADGTVRILQVEAGTQLYRVETGAWALKGWLGDPVFPTIAAMAAATGFIDGQSLRVRSGNNNYGDEFDYFESSGLAANGKTVVDATGMGVGQFISATTVYANATEALEDVKPYPDGTHINIPSQNFSYLADSTATNGFVENAGGTKLRVLPGSDGRANVLAFGFRADAAENDAEMANALSSGLPLVVPGERFNISVRHVLRNNNDIIGLTGSEIYQTTPDIGHFLSSGIDYFAVRGVAIKGGLASTGLTAADQRGAIVVQNTHDFDVEYCHFEQLVGSGVTVSRAGTYVNGGRVRFNRFTKGSGFASADPWGTQDNAPLQVYQHAKNITFECNVCDGLWYCAVLVQDFVSNGVSRIHGMRVVGNKFTNLSQYGIVTYTLATLTIGGFADNGSGAFRATVPGHQLTSGDKVHLKDCGDASGIWEVDVIDATTFDLVGSTYSASTINGEFRTSENCAGYYAGNEIDGINGDREVTPGSRPYGAGLYVQATGGQVFDNNILRRTNLSTNAETLSPGSIGINGATGSVTFTGGGLFDSGYHAMSLKLNGWHGRVRIGGGGMIISRPERDLINMRTPRYLTIFDIEVEVKPDSQSSRIVAADDAVRGKDVVLRNIVCHDFNVAAVNNFIELNEIDGLDVTSLKCRNTKPASEVFEVARILNCSRVDGSKNDFDGGESAYSALRVVGTTDSNFRANRIRMQDDGAARPAVSMTGTCIGTVFHRDNDVKKSDGTSPRMENLSTGGKMHTRDASSFSGGKTRQIGDIVENSDYADGEALLWVKTAVSTGSANWKSLTPA